MGWLVCWSEYVELPEDGAGEESRIMADILLSRFSWRGFFSEEPFGGVGTVLGEMALSLDGYLGRGLEWGCWASTTAWRGASDGGGSSFLRSGMIGGNGLSLAVEAVDGGLVVGLADGVTLRMVERWLLALAMAVALVLALGERRLR